MLEFDELGVVALDTVSNLVRENDPFAEVLSSDLWYPLRIEMLVEVACWWVSVGASGGEEAGEAGADGPGGGASSSGRVRRRGSLPRPPPHTGDWSPLALPLVM